MAARDLVLRTRELGGQLVTIGGNAARGITIEQPNLQADAYGPSAFSCILKRDPRVQWADLQAFAPVTIEAQGQVVWRGRIKNTPMTDGGTARQVALTCEGKQFHLDDDAYRRMYVHTDMSAWKDIRSLPSTPLGPAFYAAAPTVQADGGSVLLTWPKDLPITTGTTMGVFFDAGPGSVVSAFSLQYESSANSSADFLYIRTYDDAYFAAAYTPAGTAFEGGANNVYTQGWLTGTFTTPHRYVAIFNVTNPGFTPGADVWWRFNAINLYASTAYIQTPLTAGTSSTSSLGIDSSSLTADVIIKDALDRATLQFASDRSLISPTSFFIPEFDMSGPSTPREVISVVNSYHGYQFRVRADNRPEFRPLPAVPSVQVGDDSRFDEASAGDASEIYTGVLVTYTDPSGAPQIVVRSQPAANYVASLLQPTNPGANTNTTNWAVNAGAATLSRTTVGGEFTEGSGGFKAAFSDFGSVGTAAWSGGAFVPGTTYRLTLDARNAVPNSWYANIAVDGGQYASAIGVGTGAFQTGIALDWTQPSTSNPVISVGSTGSFLNPGTVYWDNLVLFESQPTIVNRWGFRRVKVLDLGMTLTPAAAQQMADVFLGAHRTTPLKGKLTITGHGRAIDVPSGRGLSCAELLGRTGDLVRIAHLIDPDTGKLGRIGRIAGANYDPVTDSVVLDIDSTSTNFEALLARMAIVTGQVR